MPVAAMIRSRHIWHIRPGNGAHGFHDLAVEGRFGDYVLRIHKRGLQVIICRCRQSIFFDQLNNLCETNGRQDDILTGGSGVIHKTPRRK